MNTKGYFVIGTDTDIGKLFAVLCYIWSAKEKACITSNQEWGISKNGKLYTS